MEREPPFFTLGLTTQPLCTYKRRMADTTTTKTTDRQFTCPEDAAAIEHAEVAAATEGLAGLFGQWMHNRVVAHHAPPEPPSRLRFEVCTGRRMFVMWATDRKEAYKDACRLLGLAPGSPFPGSIKQQGGAQA